jgi:seryl-tRNA synthetase
MNVAFKGPQPSTRSLDALAEELLLPSGIDGVYARTGAFEDIVNSLTAFISRHREPGTEILRFPPVMSRRQLETSGYLKSFPHFLGCVCCLDGAEARIRGAVARFEAGEDWTADLSAADLVLTPAACYPVYPALAGALPAGGRLVDVMSYCFRHEPSEDPGRMQMFRMHEHVRLGDAETVIAWRESWLPRVDAFTAALGLEAQRDVASDPFFGRGGKLLAVSQRDQRLKLEILTPIASDELPTAIISLNYHQDYFGGLFGITTAGGAVAHTSCVGFGLERITLAVYRRHGFDRAGWPAPVREALAL